MLQCLDAYLQIASLPCGLPFRYQGSEGRKVIMSVSKSLSIFHRAANIGDRSSRTAPTTRRSSNNSLTDKGKRGYTNPFASGLLLLAKPRSKRSSASILGSTDPAALTLIQIAMRVGCRTKHELGTPPLWAALTADSSQAFIPSPEGMYMEGWRVELETKEKGADRRGTER